MKFDKKDILIVVLCITVIVSFYVLLGTIKKSSDFENTQYDTMQSEINRLEGVNQYLWYEVKVLQADAEQRLKTIDSLESLKPKITIQYEKRYKEIDNASAIGIVNEFKGIFAKDSIR